MRPHQLIGALIERTGKPLLQVAEEMARKKSFQGTLYKYVAGNVASPSRATAEKIAKYFALPVDAIYDEGLATHIAGERGLTVTRQPVVAEPAKSYAIPAPAPIPISTRATQDLRFSSAVEARLCALSAAQLRQVEAVVVAFLDAIEPAQARGKQASA